jgi:hypothetical protein
LSRATSREEKQQKQQRPLFGTFELFGVGLVIGTSLGLYLGSLTL